MAGMKKTLWKAFVRSAILIGPFAMLVGLALRWAGKAAPFRDGASYGLLLLGALLTLAGAWLDRRRLLDRARERRVLLGLNLWAMVFLAVIVMTLANAVVAYVPRTDAWSLDLTRTRAHTLSPQTRNVLSHLPGETRITVLVGTGKVPIGLQGEEVEVTQRLRDLARLYAAESPRARVEVIDTYARKLRAEQFNQRLGENVAPDTVVIESGARRRLVPFHEMVEYSRGGPLGFRGEERITAAIMALGDDANNAVYFLTGHGEWPIEGPGAPKQFVTALREMRYRVASLNLALTGRVPEDCAVLVVAGPTGPFPAEEVEALRAWLADGGRLLLMAQPRFKGGNLRGLSEVLSDYNIQVHDQQLVIEVGRDVATGTMTGSPRFIISVFGTHPVTEGLSRLNCLIEDACPVRPLVPESVTGQAPQSAPPFVVAPLGLSSADSWGESDLSQAMVRYDAGSDAKGPLPVGVAAQRRGSEDEGARIVAFGSPSLLADAFWTDYQGNRAFAMNCIHWLARKETRLGIPPQRPEDNEVVASLEEMRAIFLITVFGMPLAAAFAGGVVWLMRRR